MAKKTRPNLSGSLTSFVSVLFLLLLKLFFLKTQVFAGPENYRQCPIGSSCEMGEFLYDDDFAPIVDATCTFTSRDPQENLFLNEAPMSSNTDGWYSLNVTTAGEDLGLYRSQICCTSGTEFICVDKSFEIVTPSSGLTEAQVSGAVWDAQTTDHNTVGSFGENLQNPSSLTAADVWAYPERTLSDFGTLIAGIWSYSTRSLNSFASLITGIWSNADRTLTQEVAVDTTGLATTSDVSAVGTKVDTVSTNVDSVNTKVDSVITKVDSVSTNVDDVETKVNDINTSTTVINSVSEQVTNLSQDVRANRYLLEQAVNAPVVETLILEGETPPPDLQSKIQETKKIAKFLSKDVSSLKDQLIALNNGWETTNYQVALNETTSVSKVLGATTQENPENNNINSRIDWLKQKWRSPIIGNLSVQTVSAYSNVSGISREIKSYGKTFISKQYLDIAEEHVYKLENLLGTEDDSPNEDTLYGYIANLEKTYEIFVRQSLELDEILEQWHGYSNNEKDLKLARIKESVLLVNKIPDTEILLNEKINDEKHRENLALALQGLIESNLLFLANDADKVTQFVWLEHGSVVFRSLITNPSEIIAQEVTVKYYLPQEVSVESVIKLDEGLEAFFDTEKNQVYVTGKYQLNPEETKTVAVEVADVWVISDAEIASIRKQTDILFESL
jgi:hypothetical protein